MNPFSPTAHGFRLIFRRPAIPMAEIAWRWSFVAAVWFLGIAFIFEYFDTLPVRALDRLLLITRQPVLIGRALQRIFHGSAFRFTEATVILGTALLIAWVFFASFGRAATVKSVLEELKLDQRDSAHSPLASLIALNWLRAAVALAALVGIAGALLVANSVWASTRLSAADGVRLFGLILFVVLLAWGVLNWWLSTAAIFVVTEASRALPAITATTRFCLESPAAVFSTGAFFGLTHLGAFVAAWGAALSLLGMTAAVGPWPVLFLELIIVVGYCGIADFLYIGRLAAYVSIIRADEMPVQAVITAAPPSTPENRSTVDQDELILSDVPLPVN